MSKTAVDTLRRWKRALAVALQGLVQEIVRPLTDSGFFDESTQNVLFSLDYDNLDSSLCARYLVQEIERVLTGRNRWNEFLNVLLSFEGNPRLMGKKLIKELEKTSLHISEDETEVVVPLLSENDIVKITKVLSMYAYKWEELCIALNLPQNVIEECRSSSSMEIKMSKVLRCWVVDKIPQAKPATLSNLHEALCSSMLNCGSASDALTKECCKNEVEVGSCELSSSYVSSLQHPINTSIKFGHFALLEVQVKSSQPVLYEWKKNGEKMHGENHQLYNTTVESNILCIENVTSSDTYSCQLTVGNEKITTKQASLKVILPCKDQCLVGKYSMYDEVPKDHWPPVSTVAFITLALIVEQKENDSDIQHNIDDILESKELTDYMKLFGTYESGLILVEGRPGSGKTTLVCKLTRDWAKDSCALKGARKVYLLSLRTLNMTKHEELFDILRPFYVDDEDTRAALKDIKTNNGKGVCFILDGLDEFSRYNKKSVVHALIYKMLLPQAMIVVASRPIGTAIIRKMAKVARRIEVLGFTKNSIHEYIRKYPFKISETALNLIEYLNVHINVLHMCYLPIHASMVCYMYMILKDGIPNTETKLYEYFTALTITRQIQREKEDFHSEFQSLSSLEGEINKNFIIICKIAFEMVKKSVQVISKSDLCCAKSDHKAGFDGPFLGLVVVDSTAKLFGFKEVYTFLHLTSQEFLCAWHISKLDSPRQREEIRFLCQKKEHQVLKFCCGLIDKSHCHLLLDIVKSDLGLLNCLQCAFEFHTKLGCKIVSEGFPPNLNGGKTILLENCSIMPLDFTAMAYVMSNCSSYVSKIHMKQCIIKEDGVKAFLLAIDSSRLHFIKKLILDFHPLPPVAVNALLCGLHHLEEIDLGCSVLRDEEIKALTKDVILSSLKVLHVCLAISDENVAKLLKFNSEDFHEIHVSCGNIIWGGLSSSHMLHTFKKQVFFPRCEDLVLCSLDFYEIQFVNFQHCVAYIFIDCGIDDKAIAIMVVALTRGNRETILTSLRLDLNNIHLIGALLLAYLLKLSPKMLNFSIFGNNIDSIGAEAIASSIENCKCLIRFDIQFNQIGDDGAIAIAKATAGMKIQLCLWNCNITEYGRIEVMKYVAEKSVNKAIFSYRPYVLDEYPQYPVMELPHWAHIIKNDPIILDRLLKVVHTINVLDVRDLLRSNFNNYFITKICLNLKYFNNLVSLNLEACHIGAVLAEVVVEALKPARQLKILNLSLNNLCTPGTMAVTSGLKFWPQLETLDLAFNAFSSQECIAALAVELENVPLLEHLNLSFNRLFSMAGVILTAKFSKLCKLILACCGINPSSAASLAQNLCNCPNLQHLDLSFNDLGGGLVDVANALKFCNLQVLVLNDVKIEFDGAKALSLALEHCINLQTLHLSENHMNQEISETFTSGLKFCKNLTTLILNHNKISPRAAARLSKCLQLGTMQHLFLWKCNIDSKGCIALAVGLRYCSKLKKLDLNRNEIDRDGARALADELVQIPLEYIDMRYNPIDEDSVTYLKKKLKYAEILVSRYTGQPEELLN